MSAQEGSSSTEPAGKDQNFNEQDKGGDSSGEVVMQQQGEVIAPEVADGMVQKIAEEVYGLKVVKCKQLNGYDDKNYHIQVCASESSNPHMTSFCPEGYVMKVVNTLDTRRPEILYAQIEFMRHLGHHGIKTQEAVLTLKGEPIAFYQFPPPSGEGDVKTHAVCLRTFISGEILYDVTLTRDLCFKVGEFLGAMTKALETFQHTFYDTFDCLWSLNNVPTLAEYVHVITDDKDRFVVDDIIAQFSSCVLPRRNEIRAGFIHGDPNEQNILVQRKATSAAGDPDEYVVAGILDFQDAACTHPLYDLAMMIAYVSLQALTFDPLEVGGHILAGYKTVLELPELEESVLRVCVGARLVQSLVLGAYNHSLDPTNDYLLTTARRGWHVLHALWDTPPDRLSRMWEDIQQSYQEGKGQ